MVAKSILIIGMGRFGKHLCTELANMGNDIMVVDINEEKLVDVMSHVTSAKIGDCTNPDVLKSIGITNFDHVIVAIDNNFQNSLEITSLAKEMGAKHVISKADREVQAKFLGRNGADYVVYPDRDVAHRLAMKLTANHIFDYITINDEYAMYEIDLRPEWVGKTLRDMNFASTYHLNVIGFKAGDDTEILPSPDRKFRENEHLLVIGNAENVNKALSGLKV